MATSHPTSRHGPPNASRRRFAHRGSEWADRVELNRPVAYRFHLDVRRGRWYLTASWHHQPTSPPAHQPTSPPAHQDDPTERSAGRWRDRCGYQRRPHRRLAPGHPRQPGRQPAPLLLRPVRQRGPPRRTVPPRPHVPAALGQDMRRDSLTRSEHGEPEHQHRSGRPAEHEFWQPESLPAQSIGTVQAQ